MGCSSCGQRAKATLKYPYDAVMPDGTRVTVTSAEMERAERSKAQARMATQKAKGYTVA